MAETRHASTGYRAVAGFTGAYLLASGIAAWVMQNTEFAFYFLVMLVLVVTFVMIDRRVRFSMGLLWCMSLWGAMHMAGGLLPVPEGWPIHGDNRVVYSWWVIPFTTAADGQVAYGIKYDQITHVFGFGVTAWACWQGLCATIRSAAAHPNSPNNPVAPTFGRLALCFTAAMGFGALNEIVEFAATTFGPTNVGGYINTSYDLISNAIGALIVVLIIRWWPRNVNGLE